MNTLDVRIVGADAKEAIRDLLARFSSKKKLERSKEMDDVMERDVALDDDYKLDIAKDILRERVNAYGVECFSYVRKLGRPGDRSHPILQFWKKNIHPMEDMAFNCKTIEQANEMKKQLLVYAKRAQDLYEKELQKREEEALQKRGKEQTR
ncbi:MAG: hypothetical protein LBL34_03310 [Clostridiales bacterium]|jgi:hypothetical protein|nr:hypothetical protein [Clostridiales bacterium]